MMAQSDNASNNREVLAKYGIDPASLLSSEEAWNTAISTAMRLRASLDAPSPTASVTEFKQSSAVVSDRSAEQKADEILRNIEDSLVLQGAFDDPAVLTHLAAKLSKFNHVADAMIGHVLTRENSIAFSNLTTRKVAADEYLALRKALMDMSSAAVIFNVLPQTIELPTLPGKFGNGTLPVRNRFYDYKITVLQPSSTNPDKLVPVAIFEGKNYWWLAMTIGYPLLPDYRWADFQDYLEKSFGLDFKTGHPANGDYHSETSVFTLQIEQVRSGN